MFVGKGELRENWRAIPSNANAQFAIVTDSDYPIVRTDTIEEAVDGLEVLLEINGALKREDVHFEYNDVPSTLQ